MLDHRFCQLKRYAATSTLPTMFTRRFVCLVSHKLKMDYVGCTVQLHRLITTISPITDRVQICSIFNNCEKIIVNSSTLWAGIRHHFEIVLHGFLEHDAKGIGR